MPLFFTKRTVFEWLQDGKKTIEIRKGNPCRGEVAVFQTGPKILRLKIIRKETGYLAEVMRIDNFRLIIPSAMTLSDAVVYVHGLYGVSGGVFTAYYLEL